MVSFKFISFIFAPDILWDNLRTTEQEVGKARIWENSKLRNSTHETAIWGNCKSEIFEFLPLTLSFASRLDFEQDGQIHQG